MSQPTQRDTASSLDSSAGTSSEKLMSREELLSLRKNDGPKHCGWCGRRLPESGNIGRRRRYCGQSCRQRAYERRAVVQRTGLPEDSVVLSNEEVVALQDRLFQVRCAAEDVATAAADGVDIAEIKELALEIARNAKDLEQLR